ncbi:hypothetical protein ACSFA2_25045 [Variovorax sp. LT2P21]|uniref:hypothetical protein n=1 Tax=Variovorax sp. LT2P21 TaxID=3443731 RepID=UPI003F45459E
MNKRDLLQELYQKELNEEEADEALARLLDSDGAADVKEILLLSGIEWTAKAQGADWRDVARWRYEGWPNRCPKCGADLNVRQFGWRVYIDDVAFLAHIRCPNAAD